MNVVLAPKLSIVGLLKVVGIVLVSVVVLIAGGVAVGVLGLPTVEDIDNRFGDVNDSQTAIHTDVVVNNPNPFGFGFAGIAVDYDVSMNDVEMATGESDQLSLSSGNSTESLTTSLDNQRIPDWWVSHLQAGERTEVAIDATVHSSRLGQSASVSQGETIETDVLSSFSSSESREVNADHALIDDPVMIIEETSGGWGDVSDDRSEMDLAFEMYNPQPYPLVTSQIGYEVSMNDLLVGDGTTEREYVIPPGATETVETTAHIDNQLLDEWWVSHVENDQVTDLHIAFEMVVEVDGLTQPITIPLDNLDYEETIETDVFGSKGDDASSGRSNGGDSSSDGPGAENGGETTSDSGGDGSTDDESGTTDGAEGDDASTDEGGSSDDASDGQEGSGDGDADDGSLLGDGTGLLDADGGTDATTAAG